MSQYLGFAIFLSMAWGIYFWEHYMVFRPFKRIFQLESGLWTWGLIVLTTSYFIAAMAERTLPNPFTRWIYIVASVWMGMIFLLFSIMLGYEILHLFLKKDLPLLIYVLTGIGFLLSLYAIINAHKIKIQNIDIPLQNISDPITIVQLSDIHIGTINGREYLQKIINRTNTQKPDFVLITGDLFDGSGPITTNMLLPFDDLSAPSYFIMGNHEVYEGLDNVEKALKPFPIKILRNESAEHEMIQIIGVDDEQARGNENSLESILNKLPLNENKIKILMKHTPSKWNIARKHGIDLQLSGHTHNGQIFPFTLIVKIFFPHIKGLYEENGQFLYTSPGTGTWGPPMRLGSQSEITVIKLIPAS